MIQEEANQRITYLTIKGSEVTTKELLKALHKAYLAYDNRSGVISIRKLREARGEIRVLSTDDRLSGFNKYCKKYGVRYALTKNPSKESENLLLFEAKNDELIAQCLKEFYSDFEIELTEESLESEALDDLVSEDKQVFKRKLPSLINRESLNEKLDHYEAKDKVNKEIAVARAAPDRGER